MAASAKRMSSAENAVMISRMAIAGAISLGLGIAHYPGAAADVLVDRYSAVSTTPMRSQRHPLATIITVTLPRPRIKTVGGALHYLLHGSGYTFIAASDAFAARLLTLDLPHVHRRLGPMPLGNALQTIVGSPYRVLVNEVRREVCIELINTLAPAALSEIGRVIDPAAGQGGAASADRPVQTNVTPPPVLVPKPWLSGYANR